MSTSTAQKNSSRRPLHVGFSLIELLIVVAIIGLIVFPLIITYSSHRTTQALHSSADQLANHTRSVRIFSREAREQKEWGIKSMGENSYVLFTSGASGVQEVQRYSLEPGVSFLGDFEILFEIGTGDTEASYIIELVSTNGIRRTISVSSSGVVELRN